MLMKKTMLSLALCAGMTTTAFGAQQQLIVNGDFETGTLAGWTVTGQMPSDEEVSTFSVIPNGDATALSGNPTELLPDGGGSVAVGDQVGLGLATELRQAFTVVPGLFTLILNFDYFINNHDGPSVTGALDGTDQTARADILFAGAAQFDTGTGVARTLPLTGTEGIAVGDTVPWQFASFDLSDLAPGSYELRFGNANCCGAQEFGVDNVSLLATVPEPGSLALALAGIAALAGIGRRRA